MLENIKIGNYIINKHDAYHGSHYVLAGSRGVITEIRCFIKRPTVITVIWKDDLWCEIIACEKTLERDYEFEDNPNVKKLSNAIEAHQRWLKQDYKNEAPGYFTAEFSKIDLFGLDLHGRDLRCADFSHADLRCTDFTDTNLSYTNFRYANLERAVLNRTKLQFADFRHTNCRASSMCGANCSNIDFTKANLYKTNFSYANLARAILINANLTYADFNFANFQGALLSGAKLDNILYNDVTAFLASQCPEEGSFIGFKVAGDYIIKLEIPADAKRSSATTRKCRASKAKILGFEILPYLEDKSYKFPTEVRSDYDENFIYKVGETVEVKNFDEDRWHECAPGIHFFLTKQEAINYRK